MKTKTIILIVAGVVVVGGVAYYGYTKGWFGNKPATDPAK